MRDGETTPRSQKIGKRIGKNGRAEQIPLHLVATSQRAQSETARSLANKILAATGFELTFEVDDQLDRVIVRLVDRKTREVVRQLPSEAALKIARAIAGSIAPGLLLGWVSVNDPEESIGAQSLSLETRRSKCP